MSTQIEFYKNRSIGERFSVAIDFLKQNWKVLYKNILLGGLPLALIMGFLLTRQQAASFSRNSTDIILNLLLYYFLFFLSIIYIYSMTGAILLHYDRNQLTETTGWDDLSSNFFRLAGKTILIALIVFIPVVLIVAIFSAIFGFSVSSFATGGAMQAGAIGMLFLFIFLLIGVYIAIAPSLTLIYFPAYFSGKSAWESIKIAFKLGFKNWGSLFVAILLTGIVFGIVYMIFAVPFQLILLLSRTAGHFFLLSYIFGTLTALSMILMYPIMFLIFVFQYFSIVEREEGVSLQSQVSDFENL